MTAEGTKKKLLLITLVILLAGAGIWGVVRQLSSTSVVRHVVLISLDTCRADHLSCYGCALPTTPNIDALARQGYLFRRAMTPIPLTLPAHASMLTGTVPPHHGKHENKDKYFDPSHVTLAAMLKTKGYRTGAFVGAQVMNGGFGLGRGFDIYHDQFAQKGPERRAEEVNRAALEWLEEADHSSVFLFLHYYDPHDTYDPPEPFATTFKGRPYAGEIAYTDHCIGQVVDKLKSLGMYESALIMVTSDHGEMLGEHGEITHSYYIYQSALRVPLVCKLPGPTAAHEIDDVVGIIDIVPTVCDLVGMDPPAGIQGESLAPYFSDKPPPSGDRHLYCESLYPTHYGANSLFGLVGERWKYIQTTRPELYDLHEDPGELANLVEAQPQRARLLKERLAEILEQTVRQKSGQEDTPLDAESLRHLRSLGYVAGTSVEEDFSFDQSKKDPKDLIGFHNEVSQFNHLKGSMQGEKEIADVRALGERLIEQRPEYYEIYDGLLNISITQKDYGSAIRYGEKALALKPGRFPVQHNLGVAYSRNKQDAAAVEQFELALEGMREDRSLASTARVLTHNQLGIVRARQGKFDLAIAQFEESLRIRPIQPDMLNSLAWALLTCPDQALRDPARGLDLARQACHLTGSKRPMYLMTLAMAHAALGNVSEAEKTAAEALALARARGDHRLVARIRKHLELFMPSVPSGR